MFAVSGWNLDAQQPTTQVDASATSAAAGKKQRKKKSKSATDSNATPLTNDRRARAPETDADADAAPPQPKRPLKKGPEVTSDNVLSLYEKIIEGKGADDAPKAKRERRKSKKGDRDAEGDDAPPKQGKKRTRTDDEDGAPPKKKTLKEKKREKKARENGELPPVNILALPSVAAEEPVSTVSYLPALTPLQQKMRQKLTSARFRHINETLYTSPSMASLSLFKTTPSMYTEYHEGFRRQVEVWPSNPVDIFIAALQVRGKQKFEKGYTKKVASGTIAAEGKILPLPRDRETGICTVADLGCGDAKIAKTLGGKKGQGKGLKIEVKSFDLQSNTPEVEVADISSLPLMPESVDIAIFCLALMGTNFLSFIEEAHRVLRFNGELWVAEIKSRFQRPRSDASSKGNESRGVGRKKKSVKEEEEEEVGDIEEGQESRREELAVYRPFVEALKKRGFVLRGEVDAGNKMFVRMEFVKVREEGDGEKIRMGKKKGVKGRFIDENVDESRILKPCVYKLR